MQAASIVVGLAMAGCTIFDAIFGPLPNNSNSNTDLSLGIAIVQPAEAVSATPGVATIIQWADIATIDGTVVRITAQRRNNLDEDNADPIELVGDGTTGSGRDAVADGDNDFFEWDITGVRVGSYVIIATIETPEGETLQVMSTDEDRGTTGAINVTTALPVPTFTFTAPGAADASVTTGNTFDITWTDNGATNADALVRLGLDTDSDHESGNEIILVSNQPLSENGNNGQFTFFFQDENGETVPDGDYTVFAIVDDNANDIVTAESTGLLQVNP
ncbi:MAG TPA: hypothetical protein P5081_06315 [Phycisphaerae bacterium]|nr:hypothetical protein [Phycisphaerae bacterium]HRW52483.1 hypothetical protein [Phycisphaerae bacterium]